MISVRSIKSITENAHYLGVTKASHYKTDLIFGAQDFALVSLGIVFDYLTNEKGYDGLEFVLLEGVNPNGEPNVVLRVQPKGDKIEAVLDIELYAEHNPIHKHQYEKFIVTYINPSEDHAALSEKTHVVAMLPIKNNNTYLTYTIKVLHMIIGGYFYE